MIFLAGVLALALALPLAKLAQRMGFVDVPGSAPHKRHDHPVPIAGGWLIVATCAALTLLHTDLRATIGPILIPSLVVFIFGLWDDARGAGAPFKLVGQVLAAVLLIALGTQVRLFPASQNLLNWGITVLWIVGITNAFNFVDSMDGLAAGLAGLAAAFFMLAAFDSGQVELSLFSALLVGACMGAYFFNQTPARLFLGDSGSQWLGFSLAALAIAYNPDGFLRTQSWFVPILLLAIPIFDASLVVFSRLRRRRPVYQGHFDHTYHRLVAFGVAPGRAVLGMQVVALLLGCLAFVTITLPPLWANVVYGGSILLWGLVILWMDSPRRWSSD
jgi:UDP-GlcNAc:undecaprenyl-phosphate GlcNAc-1-phosphate transferase